MTKLERFIYVRDFLKWKADIDGNILSRFNRKIGCKSKQGYMVSGFKSKNKRYTIKHHQFIFWFFNNQLPEQIDHIDNDRTNNRLSNLRSVNNQQNQFNRKNTKGYTFNKKEMVWKAQITIDYKQISLGSFHNETEAKNAYLRAKKIYHKI